MITNIEILNTFSKQIAEITVTVTTYNIVLKFKV